MEKLLCSQAKKIAIDDSHSIQPPVFSVPPDQLVDLFDAFATMVEKLRLKQEKEIDVLDAAIAQAKASGATEQTLDKLAGLRAHMKAELDEEQRKPA